MNFTIHDAPQGTPEWLAARAGRLTGSRAGNMLAKIKSGEAAARRDYRVQLVTERLTGSPQEDGFISADMRWGTETEPLARMAYEAHTGVIVRETGFLAHNELAVGCSLDGDIDGFRGLVEFKCPRSATHIGYLQDNRLPPKYAPQVMHNLWVTGAEWCDFVSFDPRLPDNLQLFVIRVLRPDVDLQAYEAEALTFLREVDNLEQQLRQRAA
jgi:predicted phage-related endonuclease